MNANSSGHEQKRAFDWEGARQRIAEANAVLAGIGEITPEMLEQILAQRAARLAQVPTQEDEGEQIELVLIKLGHETYGLDAQHVFEIRLAKQITHVPRVPDWVAGVVNLRGRILSAIDLRRFFGLPSAEGNSTNSPETDFGELGRAVAGTAHLVVVETPDMEVALLTDDVLAVEELPADRVQDATGTVRTIPPEYVRGVVAHKDGDISTDGSDSMIVVLDLPALLADERLIVHEEIV